MTVPISATTWKKIHLFYTIGELFAYARSIEHLVPRSEERTTMWHNLRERINQDDHPTIDEVLPPELDRLEPAANSAVLTAADKVGFTRRLQPRVRMRTIDGTLVL
jgi:hypothetical protein